MGAGMSTLHNFCKKAGLLPETTYAHPTPCNHTLAAAFSFHLISIIRLYTRDRLCAKLYAQRNTNSDLKKTKITHLRPN